MSRYQKPPIPPLNTSTETPAMIASVVNQVSELVSGMAGIQLGEKQRTMVESRLRSRMLKLKIETFNQYLKHLQGHLEAEGQALLSLMTTHHTFFFREFPHFEFLLNKGLRRLIENARLRADKTIRVWSAACSKGQEVYSLAMFFHFHIKSMAPDVKFEIWGSDVDVASVNTAKNGVYKTDELRQSPAMYLEGHWVRGSGSVHEFSKVKDQLHSYCRFETVNLLSAENFLRGKTFDLIFCRNVFFYFSNEQIKAISQDLVSHLDPHGYLFIGVSESLNGLSLKVESVGPSVYQHEGLEQRTLARLSKVPLNKQIYGQPSALRSEFNSSNAINQSLPKAERASVVGRLVKPSPESAAVPPSKPKEILCVDDSPVIHTLLAKILTPEQGFKIGAKALNGREALELLKTRKFDAITLDMHMPEVDGIGFLKEYKDRSTPIVVLSSVNRDDPAIAQQALSLGASDYVEKPSLENLLQAGNEIRSKISLLLNLKKAL